MLCNVYEPSQYIFEFSHNVLAVPIWHHQYQKYLRQNSSTLGLNEKKMVSYVKMLIVLLIFSDVEMFANMLDDYPLTTSCYIQYSHEKGKLEKPFPSLLNLYVAHIIIDEITDLFFSEVSDCIKSGTTAGEYYAYYLKIHALKHSSIFDDAERQLAELSEARRRITDLQNEMKVKYMVNVTDLGKNITWEDFQLEYCMRKLDN